MIRLDHSGKDEAKGQRGGSAKSGDVDAVWRLSKTGEDLVDLVCEAQRFPLNRNHLTLRREDDPLQHEVSQDPYMDKQDKLFAQFTENKVPKDPTLSVGNARALARQMCGPVTNFNKKTWLAWCAEPGQI
jgi:hypothetical protein